MFFMYIYIIMIKEQLPQCLAFGTNYTRLKRLFLKCLQDRYRISIQTLTFGKCINIQQKQLMPNAHNKFIGYFDFYQLI